MKKTVLYLNKPYLDGLKCKRYQIGQITSTFKLDSAVLGYIAYLALQSEILVLT